MTLQRRSFIAIISGSIISVFGQGALAANGPLVKPTRLGQVIIFRNKKYTCIKKGKVLVWDNGVAIKATASATASATPATSASASATAKPSATASALTFVAKSGEVAEGAAKIVTVMPSSGPSISVSVTRVGGTAVVLTAVCTHRGCIVEADKSELVCPCHGSSYNFSTGAVNNGPAESPLRKYVTSESAGSIFIKI